MSSIAINDIGICSKKQRWLGCMSFVCEDLKGAIFNDGVGNYATNDVPGS
jgi:hypothetical protein